MAKFRRSKYPTGPAFPRDTVTPRWKRTVLERLAANREAGLSPASPSELAEMIGVHKTGILRMLHGDNTTCRYAARICEVLGIAAAVVDNPHIERDELDRALEKLRALPAERQQQALRILETFFDLDERERSG